MSSLPRFLLTLAVLACASSATAGELYKCKDKKGVTAFTSTRAGYSQCKLVGNFPTPARTAAPKAAPASAAVPAAAGSAPAPASKVEFRTAPGAAEPVAAAAPAGSKPKVQRGAVYKYTKNGVTHYTNRKPAGQAAKVLFTYIETCFACSPSLGIDFNNVGLNVKDFADEILVAATEHGVDPALVRAVIHAESAFNPNAVSRAGAQGLMQLIPATASRFGVSEPFAPAQNIKGGVAYLAWLLKRFDGDVMRATAGYNAGEGAVDKYDGVPPYAETQVYVERVGILHERYRTELAALGGLSTATASAAAAK